MTKKRYIFSTLLFAIALVPVCAQTNGSNSPYSRYGFGLLSDGGNAFNKGMAGTAYGMRNGAQLNSKNPASYSSIDSLTFLFDFGLTMQNANLSQGGTKTNAKNTSIDYVTAGFRMAKGLGMTVGLVPFSTIGYSTNTSETLEGEKSEYTQYNTYSGDGGLHEAYGGIGWQPFHNLSIGFNAGYLWGTLDHTVLMSFDDSNVNSTRQVYSADIRTYKLDFGLQYVQRINKKNSLTFGLVYGLGHDINRSAQYMNQKVVSSTVESGDTITCPNAFQMPHTFGAGLTWQHNNSLRLGIDYTYQKWSDVKYPTVVTVDQYGTLGYEAQKGNFKDMSQISVGAEYVPNPEGLKWRQRIRYTAGFSYSTSYVLTDMGDGPKRYLASMGVSLPIINLYNNRTFLNLGLQYEHVKPAMAGMITENYVCLNIGITFNERWFMKWKAE